MKDSGKSKRRNMNERGESLIETLASLLIIVMFFTALAGAVVTSARVNARIKNESTTLTIKGDEERSGVGKVSLEMSGAAVGQRISGSQSVDIYVTKDDKDKPLYYFYRVGEGE